MIQAETLELLEWPRLCQHLSTFASTKLGAIACRGLKIPTTQSESSELIAQTIEVTKLENNLVSLSFDGIQDIGESLERAERQGILSGDELLAIATTLSGVRRLRRTVDDQPDSPVLKALVADVRTYPELEQEIHRCIDERGDVADRASTKLAEIRIQLKTLRDKIHQILHNILQRQSNAVQEQLISQRSDRFVIPVKASHKDAIPGIVHDSSSSGVTLYVEPHRIVDLGNQLRQHRRREQVEEEAIRQALTEQVAAVKPDLEQLLAVAIALDLATAKARYSLWLEANPPRFIDWGTFDTGEGGGRKEEGEGERREERGERREEDVKKGEEGDTNSRVFKTQNLKLKTPNSKVSITLRQLRHPLLIWQHKHEQASAVVPIDLVIQPQIRVVTITGPNTGGKTVTLKTLGLAALMAKVGLFVPAREPVEIPWFDQVLADIGDEQSLQQSLSTFSGHIRRISRISEALEYQEESDAVEISNEQLPKSLVLLDEVGAGTDPAEGSALAIALLHYLANCALLTMATTHYGELKALKYQDERFENASVEFDDRSLRPTYRLLWGIPGRSNALSIASRLGLKPEIIEEAQTHIGGLSQDINEVIAGLESQRRRQENKAQEAAKLLQQAERLHNEVSRKASALQEREKELKLSQERAINEALIQAKGEIAQVIRQLQQGPMTAQDAQKATNSLNEIATRQTSVASPPKAKLSFKPQVGDRIRIPKIGQTAEVVSNPNENGELTVRFGLMKMTVELKDIESLDGQKPEPLVKSKPVGDSSTQQSKLNSQNSAPIVRTSQNTLDIRGSRVADAEMELDRAIGKTQSGALWIIHGKGTGKLREGIHEFLKQHPQIERFELASQAEGGTGVTIAYLK